MTQDIVECYCGDEEDDGTMMFCEKCKKWQHAVCVNWNDFTAPAKYICPSCQGIQVECICKTEGDFQHAVIQCSKCHLYQHKRHVGFGIGKNPPYYICSKCSPTYTGGRNLKIEPILYFFPSFNEKIIPSNINSFPYTIPPGRLLNKLREFSTGSPITPVNLVNTLITYFRDVLFKSHPTLKYFDYIKFYPERHVKDACQFMFYFTKAISFLCDLSIPEVLQIFDHVISLMIYKRALPKSFRKQVTNDAEDDALEINMSDRAQDVIRSNYKVVYFQRPVENVPLKIVAGRNAFPTVISLVDIRECDFICRIWGYCMDYEEIDQPNHVPDFSVYGVARSNLFINSSKVQGSPIFQHIRRGVISNCEVRLFRTTLKGSKKKVIWAGIFATKPTIMQHLIDAKPTVDSVYANSSTTSTSSRSSSNEHSNNDHKTDANDVHTNDEFGSEASRSHSSANNDDDNDDVSSRSKKTNKNKYVIHAGEELVLPFELAPLFVKNDAEWRSGPVDPRLADIDVEMDINSFKPLKPANHATSAEDDFDPAINELNAKIAYEHQHKAIKDNSIDIETKPGPDNETTLQNIFSKKAPLYMNFIIEPTQRRSNSVNNNNNSNQSRNKNNKNGEINNNSGKDDDYINSDSDELFQITSKSEIRDFLNSVSNKSSDKNSGNSESGNQNENIKNELKSIPPKIRKSISSLAPYDPLQGKKSWYQPMQYEAKIPDLKLDFRDPWNPISPATAFNKNTKPKVTPAEFWAEDPVDFVDVSDGDLD
ncbi:hypothetical protein M9Y10_027062 [Tritrichomonas musculus]|uniref:Zinc finger PHD-type domain-containing protein n=1 Tax=Tritrichomonas musculus TaxID=1915356 RepID=A0ABR2H5G1_9EUKA